MKSGMYKITNKQTRLVSRVGHYLLDAIQTIPPVRGSKHPDPPRVAVDSHATHA